MKNFLAFVAGIGVGVAIAWSYNKNKYEEMVQEEVESLREMKSKKEKKVEDVEVKSEEIDNEAEEKYEEALKRTREIINYNNYSSKDKEDEIGPCERAVSECPLHIITPEDFASQVGYDTDSFYFYEDNIIADENNKIIENVVDTFGLTTQEIRLQFGRYEDDSVFIRNEALKMDYEILKELDIYKKRNGE